MSDEKTYSPYHILVYGGGGHAKSVIDMIRAVGGYLIAGIVDDNLIAGTQVLGVPVLGTSEILDILHEQGISLAVNTVGGIGKPDTRVKVFEKLDQAGYEFPSMIHPRAFVEPTARVAEGTQILPMAYVGSDSQIGFGCIINYGAIISHDCAAARLCQSLAWRNTGWWSHRGRTLTNWYAGNRKPEFNIGTEVRIGNGATIKKDVPDFEVIRAGAVWPARKLVPEEQTE